MYPLRDARESNPTMGGYDFGEWSTYSNQFHPGIDFNAGNGGDGDLGMPLVAVCKMALRANESTARGYGNHQWWEVLEGPHVGSWLHYCHANNFVWNSNDIDQVVNRGDVIGECGKSGNQQFAHLHFEVKKDKPQNWGYWGGGLSKDQMFSTYTNPLDFCKDYDNYVPNEENKGEYDMLSDAEKSLIETVRALNFIGNAESVIRLMAGLNANETSVEGWINEIGALKSQLAPAKEESSDHAGDHPEEAVVGGQ
jgi:hypothetical protein